MKKLALACVPALIASAFLVSSAFAATPSVSTAPYYKYTSNGDGTFKLTYEEPATVSSTFVSNVTPVNGQMPFVQSDVDPSKDYNYDIRAFKTNDDGTLTEVGSQEVTVKSPADGSGGTLDSTVGPPDSGGSGGDSGGSSGSGGGSSHHGGGGGGGAAAVATPPEDTTEPTDTTPVYDANAIYVKGSSKCVVEGSSSISFSDIVSHWSEASVKSVASMGIVDGYEDGTFKPEKSVTRAEFTAMVVRSLCLTESTTKAFDDVNAGDWFYSAVNTAASYGFVDGTDVGKFSPTSPITRQEISTIMNRVLSKVKASDQSDIESLDKFSDKSDIADWAKQHVSSLTEKGLIQGTTDTTFSPLTDAKRSEIAALLERFVSYSNK